MRKKIKTLTCAPIFFLFLFGLLPTNVNSKLSPEDISAITATGLIPLTDEQNGEYAAKDYLIIERMYVMRFDTVKFAPGSRIFFHPYSKIHVHGALFFNGTKEKPILIGKLPFSIPGLTTPIQKILDDVSISVYKDAHLTMQYTNLLDSTITINITEETSSFFIDSVKGAANKLLILDTALFIGKDIIFSASRQNRKLILPPPSVLSSLTPSLENKTKIEKKYKFLPFQISLGIGALTSAIIGIYSDRKAEYFFQRYPKETDPDIVEWCRKEYYKYLYLRNAMFIGTLVCSTAFSITFFFDKK